MRPNNGLAQRFDLISRPCLRGGTGDLKLGMPCGSDRKSYQAIESLLQSKRLRRPQAAFGSEAQARRGTANHAEALRAAAYCKRKCGYRRLRVAREMASVQRERSMANNTFPEHADQDAGRHSSVRGSGSGEASCRQGRGQARGRLAGEPDRPTRLDPP